MPTHFLGQTRHDDAVLLTLDAVDQLGEARFDRGEGQGLRHDHNSSHVTTLRSARQLSVTPEIPVAWWPDASRIVRLGTEMRSGERLIIGPSHRACESLEAVRGFAARPIRCVFAAVVFGGPVVGDEVDAGVRARTRECRVRPVAGESLRTTNDECSVDGSALAGVAGDRVGMLDVVGEVV